MLKVRELKEFLKNLDNDTNIILQVNHKNYTYIVMDGDIEAWYDEDEEGEGISITLSANATDIIDPQTNEYLESINKK